MLIALGTRSAPKIAALESAISSLGWDARIAPVAVPSDISDMPTTSAELALGAINRAANALAASSEADYGVGMEGGVAELEGRKYLTGTVAVRDRSGRAHLGWSPWVELPAWTVAAMERSLGRELGEIMDERTGMGGSKHKNGSWGILTGDRITRAESFRLAAIAAFAPWVSDTHRETD